MQRFVSDWLSLQRSHLREWVAGVHFDPLDIYQRRSDQVLLQALLGTGSLAESAAESVSLRMLTATAAIAAWPACLNLGTPMP